MLCAAAFFERCIAGARKIAHDAQNADNARKNTAFPPVCKSRTLTLGQIKNDDFNHRLDGGLSDHKGKSDIQKEECPLV